MDIQSLIEALPEAVGVIGILAAFVLFLRSTNEFLSKLTDTALQLQKNFQESLQELEEEHTKRLIDLQGSFQGTIIRVLDDHKEARGMYVARLDEFQKAVSQLNMHISKILSRLDRPVTNRKEKSRDGD